MEQSEMASPSTTFMQQMIQNKFLLLAMFLGVSAAVYFVIGMYMMLRQ